MISAVVSARIAGLDRIKSGFTSRFANRLPSFGASVFPRSSNGRSLSGNAVSPQLDLAWRMRNSVFMPHPVRPGRLRPQPTPVVWLPDGRYGHRPEQAPRGRVTRRPSARGAELSTFSVDKRVQNTVGTQHPLRFLDKGQDLSNAHLKKGDRVCADTERLNRSPGVGQKSRRGKTGLSLRVAAWNPAAIFQGAM